MAMVETSPETAQVLQPAAGNAEYNGSRCGLVLKEG